jgi:2-dehydro-3-deoxyphosphooctonate aldolase (KDO 8-P synthase)
MTSPELLKIAGVVKVGKVTVGGGAPLVLIAGPCVIESRDDTLRIAESLATICSKTGIPLIFKSSFDKANRTSVASFRGPGIEVGLEVLAAVKDEFNVPVTSDIHEAGQVDTAAQVLDLLQVPAFLSRQTDLLAAASETGLPVNVKKGQFMSPWEVEAIKGKVRAGDGLLVTERGTTFGYNNLVVDYRSFPIIRGMGIPVVFDVTHSLQLPGGLGDRSGGMREFVPYLSRAAVGCGIDGLFMEVHPDPDNAPCDGPNMWPLHDLEELLAALRELDDKHAGGGV